MTNELVEKIKTSHLQGFFFSTQEQKYNFIVAIHNNVIVKHTRFIYFVK